MKKYFLLLAVALGAANIFAAAPSATTKQELIDDFSGGLNTANPSHKISNDFSPYMRNVLIDGGGIRSVNGFVTLGSTGTLTKVTGIFPFARETGQTTFLVTDSSITLETSDFKNWVFISSQTNSAALLYWMQVRNKMWGFNGIDPVSTWDGLVRTVLNGSNNTPNVPRFRFGTYYQDRVWGLNIPGGASDLYFSAVISTDNIIIAPDDARAWPSNFAAYVGRGDGQIGTALWIYQGLLRAGKEQSIYTIYGDNPSNYNPRKEEASIGVASNDSVRHLDGKSYLLGKTGVYANGERISDLIEPDIGAMNTGISNILSNLWETQGDFSRGSLFIYGTRVAPPGLLTISTGPFFINYNTATVAGLNSGGSFVSSSYTFPTLGGVTSFAVRIPSETIPPTFAGYVDASVNSIVAWMKCDNCANELFNITTEIKNLRTGLSVSYSNDHSVTGAYSQLQIFATNGSAVPFTADDFNGGNFSMKMTVGPPSIPGNILAIFPSTTTGLCDINITQTGAQNAQFISDVATLTSVTAWGNFDSINNTNTGSIKFFIRTSTSVINISTKMWNPISPGAIINEPLINNFIQWSSTLTDIGYINLPFIDNVTISHIEGQSTDARAIAMDWDNRYWLTVTTTTDNRQRLTYVKSKITNKNPNAWMPIEGVPIDAYAKFNGILYGGSASTGSVYRLDFGTNFDGQPINCIYDTPDLILGDYFFDKNIYKYLIDGVKAVGGTLTVKSSVNQGNFTSSTFTITGSGRYTHIVNGVTKPVKTLRLRLQNIETDIGLGINNINILYEPTQAIPNLQ